MHTPRTLQPVLICALLLVGGCTAQYKSLGTVEIIDGCLVRITGLSMLQAAEIVKTWDIDPHCQVEVVTEASK